MVRTDGHLIALFVVGKIGWVFSAQSVVLMFTPLVDQVAQYES